MLHATQVSAWHVLVTTSQQLRLVHPRHARQAPACIPDGKNPHVQPGKRQAHQETPGQRTLHSPQQAAPPGSGLQGPAAPRPAPNYKLTHSTCRKQWRKLLNLICSCCGDCLKCPMHTGSEPLDTTTTVLILKKSPHPQDVLQRLSA